MSTDERIDLHDPIFNICDRLGLKPNFVRRIDFYPSEVIAEVYLPNENGAKHIDPETGGVAFETKRFEVST